MNLKSDIEAAQPRNSDGGVLPHLLRCDIVIMVHLSVSFQLFLGGQACMPLDASARVQRFDLVVDSLDCRTPCVDSLAFEHLIRLDYFVFQLRLQKPFVALFGDLRCGALVLAKVVKYVADDLRDRVRELQLAVLLDRQMRMTV